MKELLTKEQMTNLIDNLKMDCDNATWEWVQYPKPAYEWESYNQIEWDPMEILKQYTPPTFRNNLQQTIMPCYCLTDLLKIVVHNSKEKIIIKKDERGYSYTDQDRQLNIECEELIDLLYQILCIKNS